MKKYLLNTVVLIIVGLIGFMLGQRTQINSSRVSFSEPAPMGMGVIRGTVTEGASTLLYGEFSPPTSEIVLLADASGTTILRAAVTDDLGHFRFSVQPGQYLVGMSFGRSGMQIRDFTKVDVGYLQTKDITISTINP